MSCSLFVAKRLIWLKLTHGARLLLLVPKYCHESCFWKWEMRSGWKEIKTFERFHFSWHIWLVIKNDTLLWLKAPKNKLQYFERKITAHSNRCYQPCILNVLSGTFACALCCTGAAEIPPTYESPKQRYLWAISDVLSLTDCVLVGHQSLWNCIPKTNSVWPRWCNCKLTITNWRGPHCITSNTQSTFRLWFRAVVCNVWTDGEVGRQKKNKKNPSLIILSSVQTNTKHST